MKFTSVIFVKDHKVWRTLSCRSCFQNCQVFTTCNSILYLTNFTANGLLKQEIYCFQKFGLSTVLHSTLPLRRTKNARNQSLFSVLGMCSSCRIGQVWVDYSDYSSQCRNLSLEIVWSGRVRAREPASFWRKKRDSRRHFSTGFSENVVVAKTIFQMLKVLSFCDRERTERALPLSIKITC